jgi:tetratricopeptide (TPR) repeat protein
MHLHIGNVQLDTNPAEALKEFQLALQVLDSLPPEDQQKLLPRRLHATLVRKEGAAFMEMGMYSRAIPLFEQSQAIYQRFLDADPDGQLALGDMHRLTNTPRIHLWPRATAIGGRTCRLQPNSLNAMQPSRGSCNRWTPSMANGTQNWPASLRGSRESKPSSIPPQALPQTIAMRWLR